MVSLKWNEESYKSTNNFQAFWTSRSCGLILARSEAHRLRPDSFVMITMHRCHQLLQLKVWCSQPIIPQGQKQYNLVFTINGACIWQLAVVTFHCLQFFSCVGQKKPDTAIVMKGSNCNPLISEILNCTLVS